MLDRQPNTVISYNTSTITNIGGLNVSSYPWRGSGGAGQRGSGDRPLPLFLLSLFTAFTI